MAAVVDTRISTRTYPRIYPTLEQELSAHFIPIQTQKEQEEEEEQEEGEKEDVLKEEKGVEQEERKEGGESSVNGQGEITEQSSQNPDEASSRLGDEVVSPSQTTTDAREVNIEAESSAQTTNGEAVMTESSAENPEKLTLQTGESGEQTPRKDYIDRVFEEFVTNFLLGSCHIQKAAIFDLETRRPLAMNGNLRISAEEMEQLVNSLHYLQLAYRNGVTLEGKTYKVRLADGRNGILARTDREGCTVCKTHTLIIIGVHDERGNSRKCNEDVMRLGDFFRKKAV